MCVCVAGFSSAKNRYTIWEVGKIILFDSHISTLYAIFDTAPHFPVYLTVLID